MSQDAIFEDPERFVKELKNDPYIVDRQSFKRRAAEVLAGNNILKTMVTNEDVVDKLMQTKTIQDTIDRNTKDVIAEYKKELELAPPPPPPPSSIDVQYFTPDNKLVIYKRAFPKRFAPIEELTIKRQLKKGLRPQDAYSDYQRKYGKARSYSSFTAKYYRMR